MASSSTQTLNIALPTGSLGIGIKLGSDGNCVVSSALSSSPLQVDDTIVSLNGINLKTVDGGVEAWVTLFSAFSLVERNLVVQRAANNNIAGLSSPLKDSTKHNALSSSTNKKQKITAFASSSTKNSNGMEVISLLDDSDDEDESHGSKNGNNNVVATAAKMQGGNSFGVCTNEGKMNATTTSQLEPEVMEVSTTSSSSMTSTSWRQTSASSLSSEPPRGNLKDDNNYNNSASGVKNNSGGGDDDDDDAELTIVATKGQNALADFPHSRENCVTHPFSGDKQKHCSNCYCYVCDIPGKRVF